VLENNLPLAHQAVPHVHFHIIPKPDQETGLGVRWNSAKLDPARAASLADRVRSNLASDAGNT